MLLKNRIGLLELAFISTASFLFLAPHARGSGDPLEPSSVAEPAASPCQDFSDRLSVLRKGVDSNKAFQKCKEDKDCTLGLPLVNCISTQCQEECPMPMNQAHSLKVKKLVNSPSYKTFLADLHKGTLICPVMVAHCGGLEPPKALCNKKTRLCQFTP